MDTILEVQDGTISLSKLFDHIDRHLGIKDDGPKKEEVEEDGKIS